MKSIEMIFLFTMLFSTPSFAGEVIEYSDIVNPKNRFSIDFEQNRVLVGDVVERAFFCAAKNDFFCFESKALNFHVPRKFTGAPKGWASSGGLDYKIEGFSKQYSLFGSEIYRIIEGDENEKTIYLYSPQVGLIGFIFVYKKERSKTFMLTGRCGFGAADSCYGM